MSIYRQSTLGTATNQITFNHLGVFPYYRMTQTALTRREIDEMDIKLPEGLGDADYQTLEGKAYLLLSGKMHPKDEATYDLGIRALRKVASLIKQQADTDSDLGYVPYDYSDSLGDYRINVKVIYVDLPQNTLNGYKQPFRILCKVKYPVIFSQTTVSATIGSGSASVSGGIGYSFHYPVAYGASTYSSSGSLTNEGDLDGYPASIVINGPVNIPRFTDSTTGEYIEVNVNLATSGNSLIATYDQDTLSITQAGDSVLDKLTSGSTLFKLPPGINNFTLTGSSVGSGAFATISFQHPWPLS